MCKSEITCYLAFYYCPKNVLFVFFAFLLLNNTDMPSMYFPLSLIIIYFSFSSCYVR